MKDVPGLFSSFLVLFSFLFFSGPVWERHPSLYRKPVLPPCCSFCLPAAAILIPFPYHSGAALESVHGVAGAASPAGTGNSSSRLTGEAPHAQPAALPWRQAWHGGSTLALSDLSAPPQWKPSSPVTPSHHSPRSSLIITAAATGWGVHFTLPVHCGFLLHLFMSRCCIANKPWAFRAQTGS